MRVLRIFLFPATLTALAFATLLTALWPGYSGSDETRVSADRRLVPSPTDRIVSTNLSYTDWWLRPPPDAKLVQCKEPGKCVKCHDETSTMDPSHAIRCIECHGGDPGSDDEKGAHKGLIIDPGNLETADRTCGKCHPDIVRRVRRTPMALALRMINHTRFAFGGQAKPLPMYATANVESLKQLPLPSISGNIGDDLLRRSCLRCHLHTKGSARWGEHRGLGCSACHIAYPNSSNGKPRSHSIMRNVGMTSCLKCHNSNHVGADYVGLFEKDFNRTFQSPIVKGRQPPRIYGSEQHRLVSDVHFRAGMECMDCHVLDVVHGSGNIPKTSENNVRIACESCHVHGDHPQILKDDDGKMLLMRGEGRTVPPWRPDTVAHSVDVHRKKVRCSACHAAWSFQDYGLHLMLDETTDYWKWSTGAGQNDPQIQELMRFYVGTYVDLIPPSTGVLPYKPSDKWKPPVTKDWLSGEVRSGAWFRGYTARRWANPPLGLDSKGKVAIMRPFHQYIISHVDKSGEILLDRHIPTTGSGRPALIFNPYEPHTTSRTGRACHECHGNPKILGLGESLEGIKNSKFVPIQQTENNIPGHKFRWDTIVDITGNPLQYSSHPSSGPLDRDTLRRLLKPSRKHRLMWYRFLSGERP
jgi:hypothetical protein